MKTIAREVKEVRTALQLDRRLTRRDLFAIAANSYYFGDDLGGVQAASQHFFHKDPRDLPVSDAALLAGLVRAPAYYSLVTHPDRALKRRNQVLDAMALQNVISTTEAETAKSRPLTVSMR
jgi:penicillin-binding protein 2A